MQNNGLYEVPRKITRAEATAAEDLGISFQPPRLTKQGALLLTRVVKGDNLNEYEFQAAQQLVRGRKLDEISAMEELLIRHDGLFAYFARKIQSPNIVDFDDKYQEVSLGFVDAIDTFRLESGVDFSWVYNHAKCRVIDHIRTVKNGPEITFSDLTEEHDIDKIFPDTNTLVPETGLKDRPDETLELTKYLPKRQREILDMIFVYRMRLEDIASVLGTSIKSVFEEKRKAYDTFAEQVKVNTGVQRLVSEYADPMRLNGEHPNPKTIFRYILKHGGNFSSVAVDLGIFPARLFTKPAFRKAKNQYESLTEQQREVLVRRDPWTTRYLISLINNYGNISVVALNTENLHSAWRGKQDESSKFKRTRNALKSLQTDACFLAAKEKYGEIVELSKSYGDPEKIKMGIKQERVYHALLFTAGDTAESKKFLDFEPSFRALHNARKQWKKTVREIAREYLQKEFERDYCHV